MKPIDSCLPRFNSVKTKTISHKRNHTQDVNDVMSLISGSDDRYMANKDEDIKKLFVEKHTIGERGIKRFE